MSVRPLSMVPVPFTSHPPPHHVLVRPPWDQRSWHKPPWEVPPRGFFFVWLTPVMLPFLKPKKYLNHKSIHKIVRKCTNFGERGRGSWLPWVACTQGVFQPKGRASRDRRLPWTAVPLLVELAERAALARTLALTGPELGHYLPLWRHSP